MDETVKEDMDCQGKGKAKRDEWEIREDYEAVLRTRLILKDDERLADVKEYAKGKSEDVDANASMADGDMQSALGL